jgi:hypothetical protein
MMEHQATKELLGALALGAVSQEEWRNAKAHFDECPDCRDEADRLRATAETLSIAPRDITPPPVLRSRILSTIADEQLSRRPTTLRARASTLPLPAAARLGPPRRFWSGWSRYAPTAAAAGAALILLVLAGWSNSMRTRLTETEQELDQARSQLAVASSVNVFSASPRSTMVAPTTRGKLVYMPNEKLGMLMAWNLPRPPRGMVYQVWLQTQHHTRSLGILTLYPDGNGIIYVPDDIANIKAVIVTLEPEPHSPFPTGDTVLETRF